MSLLEDIFLRDEANEARELERIIDGDEYDENPRQRSDSENDSEKEDEAEEEKKRVDPSTTKTKRAVKNPRFILNPARLTGPRGIQVIPDHFKDFKFGGKGHEKEDLDLVLKKLEHWAYRLYPKFQFEDCLRKIETLGKKRPVMVHLHKIRSDQYITEETVVQKDSSDDETVPVEREEDEFDKLLQQQIELARSTPGPGSARKAAPDNSFIDRSFINAPKATSSPSISDEQKERMVRNRKLAEERRLARLKNINSNVENVTNITSNSQSDSLKDNRIDIDTSFPRKHNKSNVIDSSESDNEITAIKEPVTVDIHLNMNTKHLNSEDNVKFDSTLSDLNVQNTEMNTNNDNFNRVYNDSCVTKVGDDTEIVQINAAKGTEIAQMDAAEDTEIAQTDAAKDLIHENVEKNDNNDINKLDSRNVSECNDKDSNKHISENNDINKKSVLNVNDLVHKEVNENQEISDFNKNVQEKSLKNKTENLQERFINNNANTNVNTEKGGDDLMDVDFSDDF